MVCKNGEHGHRRWFSVATPYTSNQLHFKKPLYVAWWSLTFPGFGHYMVNSYIWGFLLMTLEFVLNNLSHLNTSIYYSMIGEFETAKEAINIKYFFVYISLYVFSAWDSYRRGVELNQEYQLAYRSGCDMQPFHFSSFEINILRKKMPVTGLFWTFVFAPVGYMYLQKVPSVIFSLFWWSAIFYYSNIQVGVYYSMTGQFARATASLNPQWLLFVPSLICFNTYDVYARIVENNKVYEIELSRYLKQHYQQGSLQRLLRNSSSSGR